MKNLTQENLKQFTEIHNLMDEKAEEVFNKYYPNQRMDFEHVSFQEDGKMYIEFDWHGDWEHVTLPTEWLLLDDANLEAAITSHKANQ